MNVNEHPTVRAHHQRPAPPKTSEPLDAAWLRQLCLDAGADDVGFVEVDRPALAEERPHIQRAFPHTRSLISFVLRMNRDNVRSPALNCQHGVSSHGRRNQ
jgi:epoxyqueuosine reductase